MSIPMQLLRGRKRPLSHGDGDVESELTESAPPGKRVRLEPRATESLDTTRPSTSSFSGSSGSEQDHVGMHVDDDLGVNATPQTHVQVPSPVAEIDSDVLMEVAMQEDTELASDSQRSTPMSEKEHFDYLLHLVPGLEFTLQGFIYKGRGITSFYRWYKGLEAYPKLFSRPLMTSEQWKQIYENEKICSSPYWKESEFPYDEARLRAWHEIDSEPWEITREKYRIPWNREKLRRELFEIEERKKYLQRERKEFDSLNSVDLYIGTDGWEAWDERDHFPVEEATKYHPWLDPSFYHYR
ncbi:hypothetical protein C8R43DRAFT_1243789 [Mycena crocata]|nr:hypothetical protein C8R43DRAFT_1243789 [Mycena crocata]